MIADYEYINIPTLIRDALGDDVDVKVENDLYATIDNLVAVGATPSFSIILQIVVYLDEKKLKVSQWIRLTDGKLDLDVFRTKYAEVLEAWIPHQAAIEARREQLDEQAEVKAQRERYACAGEELVGIIKRAEIMFAEAVANDSLGELLVLIQWSEDAKTAIAKTMLQ